MSQEPNIKIQFQESKSETSMPVPRRMPSRPAETVKPDFEQYGNVGPDSGFAMKIVNKDNALWSSHPKKKLISTIIVNLILFRASHFGRAPTTRDFHLVLGLLRITEDNTGELTDDVLNICSKEKLQGVHLSTVFNFLT